MPPRALRITEDIVPVGQFKTHLSRYLKKLHRDGRPLVITQHGRATGVLILPKDQEERDEREAFLAAVREGLEDAEAGRLVSDKRVWSEMEKEFGPLPRR